MKKQFKKRSGYQGKLEPRSQRCVHVGYDKIDFTYRVYAPETRKVFVSRDISFDELKTYNSGEKTQQNYTGIDFTLNNYQQLEEAEDSISSFDDQVDPDASSGDELVENAQDESAVYEEAQDEIPEAEQEQDEEPPQVPARTTSRSAIPVSDRVLRPRKNAETNIVSDEPNCFEEAIKSPNAKKWKEAMLEEVKSLRENKTWYLCELPPGKKVIESKWVYKLKRRADGSIERFKARLVAKGYTQRKGYDYDETFAPVARLDSIRIILSLIAHFGLEMITVDIKTAFLYGRIEEELYMSQPRGFEKQNLVCRLQRSIYGLKQAPRVWNNCFVAFLNRFGLKQLLSDPCVFRSVGNEANKLLLMAIYVDDCLIGCSEKQLLDEVVEAMRTRFEVKTTDASMFLGLHIVRDQRESSIYIDQTLYINQIVQRFGLDTAKAINNPIEISQKLVKAGTVDGKDGALVEVPYRQAIGSLLYAAIGTRPDIAFAVSVVSRYCEAPRVEHWRAVKRILRYLAHSANLTLCYKKSATLDLLMFVDADYAGDVETRRSTSGYIIKLGGAPIIWRSTRQHVIAQSSTEAEFVAASTGLKELLWTTALIKELGVNCKPATVFIDNQGALKLLKNPVVHQKTKHIDIKYKFIRELVEKKSINLEYVKTEEQEADFLTKALQTRKFVEIRTKCGLKSL